MNAEKIAQMTDDIMTRRKVALINSGNMYRHCKDECTKLPEKWSLDRHHEVCDTCPIYFNLLKAREQLDKTLKELRAVRELKRQL